MIEPSGYIGIDRNLNNVAIASSNGEALTYDLSEATRVKKVYREVRSHFKMNDVRIRTRIFRKYGQKERNKVNQILHHVSRDIVNYAKENKFAIVMEDLKGIRKLYRRGIGKGRNYRSRMNSRSFYELQRQIEYKAKCEGIPVIYVPAGDTSKSCSVCGLELIPEESRVLRCSLHGTVDRDVNATFNIFM
ncbi:MAG: RNA-guided endonuclease TnpB family protein [Candidatus Methanomethylicaceae archaeon]